MSGKKSFDETAAIDAAMRVFRLNGFSGAGLAELERATGLNRSSLYNAFGSKEGLFLRCLERFRTHFQKMALSHLDRPDLRRSVLEFCEASAAFSSPHFPGGCVASLASLELGGKEAEIDKELRAGMEEMIEGVRLRLQRGLEAGELPEGSDLDALAAMIVSVTRGVVVMSMATRDAAAGRAAINGLMSSLFET